MPKVLYLLHISYHSTSDATEMKQYMLSRFQSMVELFWLVGIYATD